MGISIVIPMKNDEEGAYLTSFAAIQQLEKTDLDFEIIIAADGGSPNKWEVHPKIRCFRLTGGEQPNSPLGARDSGIRNANFDCVVCIDSHVIISDFKKWHDLHAVHDATISFPMLQQVNEDRQYVAYWTFNYDTFWHAAKQTVPPLTTERRVQFGDHGALMFSKKWYIENNGYTREQKGYGGEQCYLNLKAWMMGGSVWLFPQIWHAHYAQKRRPMANNITDVANQCHTNMAIAAYVMGGREYMQRVSMNNGIVCPKITPEMEKERRLICSGPFQGNLDVLREYWKREGIE